MWDKDFLYNDCIAEGMLDLGKHFRRAYKKKTEVLKLFESVQTERAKEAIVKTQQALKSEQVTTFLGAGCFFLSGLSGLFCRFLWSGFFSCLCVRRRRF